MKWKASLEICSGDPTGDASMWGISKCQWRGGRLHESIVYGLNLGRGELEQGDAST